MTEPTDKARDYPQRDFRDTVFLPKTLFPMKAGLPAKEPGIQARWESEGLYRQLREARRGAEKFILHDGPPYANGDMHIGHALNHILKDMVCRTQNLIGKDAPYVPGWDCHGLPIEWKVEEQYRKKKLNKDEVPAKEFRAECRAYAQHWVDTQREQLKRLGIMGDWDNPYLTMDSAAEAVIVGELLKFAEAGNLYRGSKPVMWSPVEKTALAEAEVEYEDITSTQIDVAFEIVESPIPELVGAHAVIWTTTPWTIPVNQAIAYGPEVEYVLLSVTADTVGVGAKGDKRVNEVLAAAGLPFHTNRISKFLVAKDLATSFADRLNKAAKALDFGEDDAPSLQEYIDPYSDRDASIEGADLAGTLARHPIYNLLKSRHSGEGRNPEPQSTADAALDPGLRRGDDEIEKALAFFARPRPFLPGDFVTTETGTGLVHMAPDHGEDDFELCRTLGKGYGVEPQFAVTDDGKYREDWAWLGGQGSVINAKFNAPDGPICNDLREAGALLAASADYQHSYPHSWRSKAKVIFRCTPQWFVPMDRPLSTGDFEVGVPDPLGAAVAPFVSQDHSTLRQRAMAEIERVRFVPEKGRNRIAAMVEGRPDWVLSRQRAWGVPITLFLRSDGSYLQDPAVNARIVAAVREQGVDAWDETRKAEFLGPDHNPDDFEMVTDILDVWFDSGSTHAFVLESGRWPDLKWPADLYLEGSDQHRGWFQSSLLESCATRGRAPYDQVLTHGFTMDSAGKKMSKSLGNTVDPLKLMETYGADIIRLWALSVDFTEDHRIGDEILKGVADQYRKLRNTFRYLLGALEGYDGSEGIDPIEMPELERYMLTLLAQLDTNLRQAVEEYDFNTYVRALTDFCNEDLSAFYFDIRKDCLYCDATESTKRRSCRTVLDTLFHALIRYAAPVLVFTAEEVWSTRYPDAGSVHLLKWPEVDAEFDDQPTIDRWLNARTVRRMVNEAIEPLRREKTVGSSLEAEVSIAIAAGGSFERDIRSVNLEEICIVSGMTLVGSPKPDTLIEAPSVTRTTHHKCGRCWRHLPEVAEDGALCSRCDQVVEGMGITA